MYNLTQIIELNCTFGRYALINVGNPWVWRTIQNFKYIIGFISRLHFDLAIFWKAQSKRCWCVKTFIADQDGISRRYKHKFRA